MRILVINRHMQDFLGGSELQCHIVADYLRRFGHEVVYGIAHPLKSAYQENYFCHPLPKPFLNEYIRLLKEFRPHVIYWRLNKHNFLFPAAIAAKAIRCKFVFAITSYSDSERWIWTGRKKILFQSKFQQNGSLPRELLRFLVALSMPIRSAWNYNAFYIADGCVSLRTDLCGKLPVKREICIHDSMISDYDPYSRETPYILWVANLKPKKNPEKFIELAEQLQSSGVEFLMIGNIQDHKYDYVKNHGSLPVNCYYLGPKSIQEVNGVLRSALFMVHTCDPEGFPNNFIQAWMQEKPTVSLYFDPESVIETNKLGFFSRTTDRFREDVRRLISDGELRRELGRNALSYSKANFAPEYNIRKIEKFLIQITEQAGNESGS